MSKMLWTRANAFNFNPSKGFLLTGVIGTERKMSILLQMVVLAGQQTSL